MFDINIAEEELLYKLKEIQHKSGFELLERTIEKFETFSHVLRLIPKQEIRKIHSTEEKYPQQTKRFREIIEEMYQTHLDKNADYSSWNINGTGLIGLVVRFWDKCARIMNLSGFDIGTGQFTGAKKNLVLDESIIDSFKDAGVYSIIARIWAEGKWGK